MSFWKLPSLSGCLFLLSSLAIIAGFVLTGISWVGLCTEQCAATHYYRLFGLQFQHIGLGFFFGLTTIHFFSRHSRYLKFFAGLMLAGALGAEVMFIIVQKYEIGQWCPVCLGIATAVGIAAISYLFGYSIDLTCKIKEGQKDEIMKSIQRGLGTLTIFLLGFLFAFVGIGKIDHLKAQEMTVREQIAFGNEESEVDVYIFTDWACTACRSLEPEIVKMAPEIMKKARLTFVDYIIHPETLNFIPYNLSFMIHNKDKYFQLRDLLTEISVKTLNPSEDEIAEAAESLGINYEQLNYSVVAAGIKYFKHLSKEFGIRSTPTMVIVNKNEKKGKKLYGSKEITSTNVMKAIDSLQ